ncbi:hypothetical protein [Massilia sp. CFBP9026]|uniref:hypothetical protein n=1 Tax=Massilia sp. CFBP9026 TaxID=3096536 RepID=UPI002A6A734A|nr:hypothetical protein [Massilia sp. CFBP9026]MDY0963235.1 hypothetical protein [Massilia sp. CFBP9026]
MTAPQSTHLAWLRKYARANPLLALWSLMLFCGGSVLLSYHADLAYLPDFSLVDLAGLMASVTLIGLMLVVFFLFSCFLPGLTLRWFEHQWPLVPYRRYFDFTEMVVLWISSVAIWAVYVLYGPELLSRVPATIKPYLSLFGTALVSAMIAMAASRRTAAGFSLKHWRHRLVSRHIVAFSLWIMLFVFPIQAALKFATAGDDSHEIPLAIGAVALLTIFNGVVYIAPLKEIRESIGIDAIIAVVILSLGLGLAIAFPQSVMQSLALGHRNAATLTVTGASCHSLARFGVPCAPALGKEGTIELENVNVLSRVGATVLLELLVEQSEAIDNAVASSSRAGILHIDEKGRRPYCPSAAANSAAACSACDARILQRAHSPADAGKDALAHYRKDLICIQLTVPKSDITNIAFGTKRQYSGYSGFNLLGQTGD